jgi:hypothetical protein
MASNTAFVASQIVADRSDEDGDGLADSWERHYFAGTSVPNGGANEDWDGDGIPNRLEYIAGTNPDRADDYFDVQAALSAGILRASFLARRAEAPDYTGQSRYYALEHRTNLLDGAWSAISNYARIFGNNQTVLYTNSTPGPQFYRGRVWLETQ